MLCPWLFAPKLTDKVGDSLPDRNGRNLYRRNLREERGYGGRVDDSGSRYRGNGLYRSDGRGAGLCGESGDLSLQLGYLGVRGINLGLEERALGAP
jgi:hypothetical protein